MNRPSEFRVFDGKKMIYGEFEDGWHEYAITSSGKLVRLQLKVEGEWSDTEQLKVSFYTGLKDKNGVKIFEGDIVKSNEILFRILWSEKDAGFYLYKNTLFSLGNVFSPDTEVIGNIYEKSRNTGEN